MGVKTKQQQPTLKPFKTFATCMCDPKQLLMVLQPQWQTLPGPAPQGEEQDCPTTYVPKEQEGKEKRQPPPHPGLKSFWIAGEAQ